LRAQTPQGCVIESDEIQVQILKADFAGNFMPPSVNICEGESFLGISFTPSFGSDTPDSIIWMRGNQEVLGASNPFVPTQSGLYWAKLVDENGCIFNMASQPVLVTIRQQPYVSITGENSLCGGESTTLQGVVTDSNLE